MSAKFDLSSYDDMKANADKILDKLAEGVMPCDGPWPEDQVPLLLDEGTYLCSTRTMYRILAAHHGGVRERRNQLTHPPYANPELLARRPNELWSRDISKLKGPAKWTWLYLYVILDVFSRYVVGWAVQYRETAQLAKALIEQATEQQQITPKILRLHADRGAPQGAKLVAFLLADLGITKTHSRPYTSPDNPYSESNFKTLKYRPEFPERFDDLRETVLERSWDEEAQTLSEHLDGGGALDASLLALPWRQVVPADHPRMVATTAAVADRLSAGCGLLYRYRHDEGALVLCSFWLVENLAKQGQLDKAAELYASLCARTSPIGLLPEQIDPSSGEFVGNFPQAFSHIGVIAAGVTLSRTLAESRGRHPADESLA